MAADDEAELWLGPRWPRENAKDAFHLGRAVRQALPPIHLPKRKPDRRFFE